MYYEDIYRHDHGYGYRPELFEAIDTAVETVLRRSGEPPEGYPGSPVPDTYAAVPFHREYEERRRAFLRHCLVNPAPRTTKGLFHELVRIAEDTGPVYEALFETALELIRNRHDGSDTAMLGILRLLYRYPGSRLVRPELYRAAEDAALSFKYWPDEPGTDSMCYWTESRQITFSVCEYLAGQLYPERIFTNSGAAGFEKTSRARVRILEWLALRYRTGFSEWLSNLYYDEDMTALLSLVEFSADEELALKAKIVLDLLVFDLALHIHRGLLVSTHGRTYGKEKRHPFADSVSDTAKLLFGTGIFSGANNMSAAAFALSEAYRMPAVLYHIANDTGRTAVAARERVGINIRDAKKWGINGSLASGMTLLSFEAYAHPAAFRKTVRLLDRYRLWDNGHFTAFAENRRLITVLRYTGLNRAVTKYFEKDLTRRTREEANLYTYRTPDYQLSSAQDYRKGFGGERVQVWTAALGGEAVCFTAHPESEDRDRYWEGDGTLPRVGQVENVAIAIYNVSRRPGLYRTNRLFHTHAWFPRSAFDDIYEHGGWIFGRKGDGYIALYSANGYRWQNLGPDAGKEAIADGERNIWICEMGRSETDGAFMEFVHGIIGSPVEHRGLQVRYRSPSQGFLEFGWNEPFRKDGVRIPLSEYNRYENPYCLAVFPPGEIVIREGDRRLRLEFFSGVRECTGTV